MEPPREGPTVTVAQIGKSASYDAVVWSACSAGPASVSPPAPAPVHRLAREDSVFFFWVGTCFVTAILSFIALQCTRSAPQPLDSDAGCRLIAGLAAGAGAVCGLMAVVLLLMCYQNDHEKE